MTLSLTLSALFLLHIRDKNLVKLDLRALEASGINLTAPRDQTRRTRAFIRTLIPSKQRIGHVEVNGVYVRVRFSSEGATRMKLALQL